MGVASKLYNSMKLKLKQQTDGHDPIVSTHCGQEYIH